MAQESNLPLHLNFKDTVGLVDYIYETYCSCLASIFALLRPNHNWWKRFTYKKYTTADVNTLTRLRQWSPQASTYLMNITFARWRQGNSCGEIETTLIIQAPLCGATSWLIKEGLDPRARLVVARPAHHIMSPLALRVPSIGYRQGHNCFLFFNNRRENTNLFGIPDWETAVVQMRQPLYTFG